MLMSCKCLNFIATSNTEHQKYQQGSDLANKATSTTTIPPYAKAIDSPNYHKNGTLSAVNLEKTVDAMSSNNNKIMATFSNADSDNIVTILKELFLEKYPRHFIYYSQCMEFFNQAIGPIINLNINEIAQKDLIFSLTLNVASQCQTWQLSICGNCNMALCAKLLAEPISGDQSKSNTLMKYFVNNALVTNSDELMQKRCNISFSEAFGLLIMDHSNFLNKYHGQSSSNSSSNSKNLIFDTSTSTVPFNIGSVPPTSGHLMTAMNIADPKQQRLRQLLANMQQRVQREIANTDERIQRYTNQQFALLKDFREKSEQEYQMLAKLIQSVSDQFDGELLDRTPINLDVNGGGSNSNIAGGLGGSVSGSGNTSYLTYHGARRRNTIVTTTTTTTAAAAAAITAPIVTGATIPTIPTVHDMSVTLSSLSSINISQVSCDEKNLINNKKTETNDDANVSSNNTAINNGDMPNDEIITNLHQRKLMSFDTPPATPEAIIINMHEQDIQAYHEQEQQQQQPQQQQQQQQFPIQTTMNIIETADDCLFELDDINEDNYNKMSTIAEEAIEQQSLYNITKQKHQPQQQQQSKENLKRQQEQHQDQRQSDMSDLDESDNNTDDAQDAWGMQTTTSSSGQQMSMAGGGKSTAIAIKNIQHELSYAKSLPMEIPKSPPIKLERKNNYRAPPTTTVDDNEIDNKMDIAASIKALAKSVHGETVFGDLPRPRLRSQI